jgi:hypothetical protein
MAVLALGLSACGKTKNPSSAENNGVYVDAGAVTYQLEISRQLNPYSTEDSEYVKGVPAADASLDANHLWYGVFLWAKNQTRQRLTTASRFDILDTEGNHYDPIPLTPSSNAYAWTSEQLTPNEIEPKVDTTASFGPTQGGLLLFKLPNAVYDNRPLMLEIYPAGGGEPVDISLDL